MATRSIVCVNTAIPTAHDTLSYHSGGSLRDYDIVIFDPELPYRSRIEFSGGGSCISIEAATQLIRSISHWSSELSGALAAGKTVFVLLASHEVDQAAVGSSMTSRNQRTYQTSPINNYGAIPTKLQVRNARGQAIAVRNSAFKGLYEAIKEIAEYSPAAILFL